MERLIKMILSIVFDLTIIITLIIFSINIIKAFKEGDIHRCSQNIKYEIIIIIFILCTKLTTKSIPIELICNMVIWYICLLTLIKA